MPWASKKQAAWGHSPTGEKALGGPSKVSEWDNATVPGSLPEQSDNAKPKPKIGALRGMARKAISNV